jgi:hypothetical protein
MQNIFSRSAAPLLLTYLCLAAASLAMLVLARNFPGAHMGAAAPGFFPQVIAGILLLLCLLGILELRSDPPAVTRVPLPVFAAMALSLGYIGGMIYIGYYPSTFIFAFLIMSLARGGASWLRLLIDSAIITFCSYLFFEVMIDAYLPTGVLFDDI